MHDSTVAGVASGGDLSLVTGVAGFIGSQLAERLLGEGRRVRGIDRLSPYYSVDLKRDNLTRLSRDDGFEFVEADLVECDLAELIDEVDVVFHLAAQAGVRVSWGSNFETYVRDNLLATHRLLESARDSMIRRFVYASSSSVYGNAEHLPVTEDAPLRPLSPYGVTKAAVENLCNAFHLQFDVPVVGLRYFTVFGPGQRPDMAFNRFIRMALENVPLTIFGDGKQRRDFTFVGDAVAATLNAGGTGVPGGVYNIAGGSQVSVAEVIEALGDVLGIEVPVTYEAEIPGDVRETHADSSRARHDLAYEPEVGFREGLGRQVRWQQQVHGLVG